MTVQPIQATMPITQAGDLPSAYLVQVIQQMAREIEALRRDNAALTLRVEALEP